MQTNLIKIQSFLICLIPLMLITGPAIPDILISITGLIFIFSSIKYKLYNYYLNPIIIILFIFSSYLIFSTLLSDYIFHSFESSLFYWRFTIFSLSCWYVMDNYRRFSTFFLISISFSILICNNCRFSCSFFNLTSSASLCCCIITNFSFSSSSFFLRSDA